MDGQEKSDDVFFMFTYMSVTTMLFKKTQKKTKQTNNIDKVIMKTSW